MILFLVIYTAVFTPYVAAFLLNEADYQQTSSTENIGNPIFIIDLLGELDFLSLNISRKNELFHYASHLLEQKKGGGGLKEKKNDLVSSVHPAPGCENKR